MKNYSRQREVILSVLRSTRSHPTAAEVYQKVRETMPRISLGTVYRNLSELRTAGNITSIWVKDGAEHFDADISPHLHLCCKVCGRIADLPVEHDLLADTALKEGFSPETSLYVVYGTCKSCHSNDLNK